MIHNLLHLQIPHLEAGIKDISTLPSFIREMYPVPEANITTAIVQTIYKHPKPQNETMIHTHTKITGKGVISYNLT
jgi:hypothetical protein